MTDRPARHIDVLMCTFRRVEVTQSLTSLDQQILPEGVTMRVIVADNDDTPSAKQRVESHQMSCPVHYVHAPARNISIARNACLDHATGDWVAFIDDDEMAAPDWLATLLRTAESSGADGVFGPAIAEYGPDAPDWMRQQDHHSNIPERRGGVVQTGHTCNAMLRWGDVPWRDARFDLARGQSGGEDTEFFFRLGQMGARFELEMNAIVTEPVAPKRLTLGWLLRRKFRMGQSYAASAPGRSDRIRLFLSAAGKAAICGLATAAFALSPPKRRFWALRGALHLGVCAGCLSLRQPQIYGQ
ncbi:glycosyltransferase family 2 protein [Actibacterium ureilyticum]|uniref:glycosyltransferase family 2 protein n=1 Tax=Actibacterium ureilyticum TaxID=1590614 RepID=UPI000BAADC39|nr:glycosyltransferase family 2 protein [Actibacterium ureilyticum]